MKKIVSIFLLLIICINHLNIIDLMAHFCIYNSEKAVKEMKKYSSDEETDSEKECSNKEKSEEQEKYITQHCLISNNQFQLSTTDLFYVYNTRINTHPYQDKDIQPPKTV